MSAEGFNIRIEGDHFLTIKEIWPDGDAPEDPTAEDVVKLIHSHYGSFGSGAGTFLQDWNLEVGVDVDNEVVWT